MEIMRENACYGCSACLQVCPYKCIDMINDAHGFMKPYRTNECKKCGKCTEVCIKLSKDIGEAPLNAFGVVNKDARVRIKSSSGGVFPLLAQRIIQTGGFVCGAVLDNDFVVRHKISNIENEISSFQGSKYVQSDLRGIFVKIMKILSEEKDVLFVGTPCQVHSIKLLSGKYARRLYTCDLICHGVPSPGMFADHIKYIEKIYGSTIDNFVFRSKKYGWRDYGTIINLKNSVNVKTKDLKSWINIYLSNRFLNNECYKCKYADIQRYGDISMGDFWEVEKVFPQIDDNKGVSLILVNSRKGIEMFKTIRENIYFREIDKYEIIRNGLTHFDYYKDNENAWEEYHMNGYSYIIEKYGHSSVKDLIRTQIVRKMQLAKNKWT